MESLKRHSNGHWNGHLNGHGVEACRVATYSPGMVGFGHIRRNASIAQALRASTLQPAVMMLAEAWQAGSLPMPSGVDCVTLPALRKEAEGNYIPRFVDISDQDLVLLRSRVIRGAMEAFDPDVMIVDHLPLGAARELAETLYLLRERHGRSIVLGLRDVLQDRDTVRRAWADPAHASALRDCYDAIWIYSDPAVYDLMRECPVFDAVADRVHYTGYLDQRPRLELVKANVDSMLSQLPEGRLALCVVGGGFDGDELAEAFLHAELPDDMIGVVVTGPYMPEESRMRLNRALARQPRMQLIDFLPEPVALIERADRVVAMGGYNTVCEVLSFEKHALIVPRVRPGREQWIRAQRLRELGLVRVLHPDRLTPRALSDWLAADLGAPPPSRSRVDFGGLARIPGMMAALISASQTEAPALAVPPALAVSPAPAVPPALATQTAAAVAPVRVKAVPA
jgi:predicted glycosyltransferase